MEIKSPALIENQQGKKGETKGKKLGALPFLLVKEPTGKHGFWENRKASRQIPLRTNSSN